MIEYSEVIVDLTEIVTLQITLLRFMSIVTTKCYIGIDLDLSKPKGMPFDLKLHTYSFTTKYINVAKA